MESITLFTYVSLWFGLFANDKYAVSYRIVRIVSSRKFVAAVPTYL